MSRREEIEKMLETEPNDIFLRYALAMEFDSEGQADKSLEIYKQLMQDETPHVPSYFRVAQILAGNGETDESRKVLREGIEIARNQGDFHAAGEMSELLQELGALG